MPLTVGARRLMPPAGARRLFAAYDDAGPAFLTARLLEDGDSADLRWLTAAIPETDLAAWLERHGARQLSRRSLVFWELALDRRAHHQSAAAPPGIPALEPLARTAVWPL